MNGSNGRMARSERMLAAERRARIVEIVERRSSVSTADLQRHFGISAVTARSDLSALEQEGQLKRMYGGAVSLDLARQVSVPEERKAVHAREKEAIAERAAELVCDGDTIALDTGTSTHELVGHLAGRHDLTVITNDLSIAASVEQRLPDAELVVLGGIFRRSHRYTYGQLTRSSLELLHSDKLFLATNSFLPEKGFMTEFEPAASVKMALIDQARSRFVLMDSSKIGANGFFRFARIDDIDAVITEADPERAIERAIGAAGSTTKLIIA